MRYIVFEIQNNADEIQYIRRAMVQTATSTSNGLMSAADKAKLDSL